MRQRSSVGLLLLALVGACGKDAADEEAHARALAAPKADDISDAEAEQYYRDHQAEFMRGERVRASAIHVPDRKAADRMLTSARALSRTNAAGFAALAKANSKAGPYRMGNGDLGVLDADFPLHPPGVIAAAFALKEPGDISDVVASNDGFHVLRLVERQPKRVRPFAEVKAEAKARLFHQRRAQAGLRPAAGGGATVVDAGRAR
jgi:parvulin-like peptidyl-prolyl isomerase